MREQVVAAAAVSEADLQAFVDGQLDTPGRIEVERWLEAHPDAAAEAMEGMRLRDELRLFLADEGVAPAAPATVAHARALARRLAARSTGLRVRRAIAAALLVGAGWFAHAEFGLLVDRVAAAHPVPAFAVQAARSLDNLPARAGPAAPRLAAPAAPRSGGEVPLPDLGPGARLVAAETVRWEGGTGVVAVYRTGSGGAFSLFAGEAPGFDVTRPRGATVLGHPTVFWQTGPYAYALSGGVPQAELLDLARRAAAAAPPPAWASFVLSTTTEGAPHG